MGYVTMNGKLGYIAMSPGIGRLANRARTMVLRSPLGLILF